MSLPESITRKLWIGQALAHAGWSPIMPFNPSAPRARAARMEYPTTHDPADYVLIDANQPLTVVAAKRPSLAPQNVLTQAQRYALTSLCFSGCDWHHRASAPHSRAPKACLRRRTP